MKKFFNNLTDKQQAYLLVAVVTLLVLVVLSMLYPSLVLLLVTLPVLAAFYLWNRQASRQAARNQWQQHLLNLLQCNALEAVHRIEGDFPQLNFSPESLYRTHSDLEDGVLRLRIYIPRKKSTLLEGTTLADFKSALQIEVNRLLQSGVADPMQYQQPPNAKHPALTVTIAENVGKDVVVEVVRVTTPNADNYCSWLAAKATQTAAVDTEDKDIDFG